MVGLQLRPTVPGFMLAALFCLFVLFVCFGQSLNMFSKIDSNYLAQPDFQCVVILLFRALRRLGVPRMYLHIQLHFHFIPGTA